MIYLVQIDDEVREATAEEAAAIEVARAESAQREAELVSQQAAKESARAKLAALGLTDDEIKALIP